MLKTLLKDYPKFITRKFTRFTWLNNLKYFLSIHYMEKKMKEKKHLSQFMYISIKKNYWYCYTAKRADRKNDRESERTKKKSTTKTFYTLNQYKWMNNIQASAKQRWWQLEQQTLVIFDDNSTATQMLRIWFMCIQFNVLSYYCWWFSLLLV